MYRWKRRAGKYARLARIAGLRYDAREGRQRTEKAMSEIPIDWVNVNWLYVAVLAVFVFVSTLIGEVLSFHNRGWAAFLSAILFAVIFVFWSYYPHHLPLPTALNNEPAQQAEPAGMPSQTQAPQRPRNPVTDITPPKNPITDITPPKP